MSLRVSKRAKRAVRRNKWVNGASKQANGRANKRANGLDSWLFWPTVPRSKFHLVPDTRPSDILRSGLSHRDEALTRRACFKRRNRIKWVAPIPESLILSMTDRRFCPVPTRRSWSCRRTMPHWNSKHWLIISPRFSARPDGIITAYRKDYTTRKKPRYGRSIF